MKKRIKLKKKHGVIISCLFGLSFYIFAIIALILGTSPTENVEFAMFIIMLIIGPSMLAVTMYIILDMIFNFKEEENKENTFLNNKEDFTEVFYKASNWETSEGEMILSIFKKEEIKFFAKLRDDATILLVVRNKNNEEIYNCEISNFCYFNAHFLKEKI